MADLWPEADVGEVIEPGAVILSFEAASAITKGKAVYLSADMKVSQCTLATQYAIGIATKTVAVGEFCPVCVRGVVKVTAGGAINRGAAVQTDASGNVIVLADGSATYAPAELPDRVARALGMALQTFASGDTGLIYVDKA
jgi:hypothetical protein